MAKLLYDATTDGLWYWYIYPSLLPITIIGGFLARRIYRSANALEGRDARTRRWLAFGLLAIAVAAPAGFAWSSYSGYRDFRDRLARGDVTVVEGTVQDFVPQHGNPVRSERFRIGDHEYEYRDEEHAPGYHTLRANGGVITDGLVLRIADIDGRIARIELIE